MSLPEVWCFQWMHGYGIVENVAKLFWESTLSRMQVFSEDREVIENLANASHRKLGSDNDDNIEKVKETERETCPVGIRELAEDMVNVFGNKRINARLVPKHLNPESITSSETWVL